MVWLLGIPIDRKSFPQVAGNACSDRLLPTFSKDNDAKKYCSIGGYFRGIYLYSLFVCLLLCSTLFLFPLIFAEPFLS